MSPGRTQALSDRSRRPVRYANQLPGQVESLIVSLKRNKPHWGARKIRALPGDIRPAGQKHHPCRARSSRARKTHGQTALPRNGHAPVKGPGAQ